MTIVEIAHDSQAGDKEAPLSNDIRLLGNILGDIIRAQEGEETFGLVEAVRQTAIRFRRGNDAARIELSELLDNLTYERAIPIIRAFSYFSHLANIAEDQHHIRRARMRATAGSVPRDGTLMRAPQRARDGQIEISAIKEFFYKFAGLSRAYSASNGVQRKSTLDREREIAGLMAERDRQASTPDEESENQDDLRRAVLTLWQTNILRRARLKVIDEITNGLAYYDQTFLTELPRVYERCEYAIDQVYEEYGFEPPSFFRMGSWIGGDRDGNGRSFVPFCPTWTWCSPRAIWGLHHATPIWFATRN